MPRVQTITFARFRVFVRRRRRTQTEDDSSQCAAGDLRQYLQEATIPTISRYDRSTPYCLPLTGQRTHKNKLKVRHDAERRLAKIRHYDTKAFNDAVLSYHRTHIYGRRRRPFAGKHYERREGEALVLPSYTYRQEAPFEDIPYPCDIEQTCRWVLERPLRTMQRAMHLAFPDTTRWWLDAAGTDTLPNPDRELWRTYVWRFHPDEHHDTWWRAVPDASGETETETETETEAAPPESMVVAVQAPWILGPQDLQDVAECTSLPPFSMHGTPPEHPLTAAQRVWAKLHDTCRALDCRAFALTNYHAWVFGAFSDDWATARASEAKEFDATQPNVMQSLVYWVAASMDLAGAASGSIATTEEQDAPTDSAHTSNE